MPKRHIRDINLYYKITGEGQPLLFIGGGQGMATLLEKA